VSEATALIPTEVTVAAVEAELAAIEACTTRWGWQVESDLDLLLLRFATTHPADGRAIYLQADLTGYKAVPPAWLFTDSDWVSHRDGAIDKALWPAPGTGPRGSVFHGHALVCAPWNRLAYQELGGVHNDWAGITNWLNIADHTRATTVPDMLAILRANLADSPGWMA
jgi:hypothetical protein